MVILLFHSNTNLKWVARLRSQLWNSLPAILKEIGLPFSNQTFAEIYGTHNHATTSFSTQNGSKAVDLAFNSSNGKWSVLLLAKY